MIHDGTRHPGTAVFSPRVLPPADYETATAERPSQAGAGRPCHTPVETHAEEILVNPRTAVNAGMLATEGVEVLRACGRRAVDDQRVSKRWVSDGHLD